MSQKRECNQGPAPNTEDAAIDAALDTYISQETPEAYFQLGVYAQKSMTPASGVVGKGILSLRRLLLPLLMAQPQGRFCKKKLEARMLHSLVVHKGTRLNSTSYPDDIFACFVAKRMIVVFSHWRKLLNPTRFAECCSKLEQREVDQLTDLVQTVTGTDPRTPPLISKASPLKRRRLQHKTSEPLSLDDDGFPIMLDGVSSDETPVAAPLGDASSSRSAWDTAMNILEKADDELQDTAIFRQCCEVAKTPLPSKRGAVRTMALASRAKGDDSCRTGESQSFGKIRVGPFTKKSYIQKQNGKAWKSIVNISGMTQEFHNKIAWKLLFSRSLQNRRARAQGS